MSMITKTVRINGVDEAYPEDSTLFSDFLKGLNDKLSTQRRVISKISIDGRELTDSEENRLSSTPLSAMGSIEVETANPTDLAYETLDTLERYLDRIVSSIQGAAAHYRTKNLLSADACFARAIDGLDLFVQTIGGVKLTLRIGLNTQLALVEAELISIMNDLLDAKRQNNYVFMAELLDKELVSNLVEWKEKIFPIMRTFRSS